MRDRFYTTNVVIRFAAHGVAIGTIACALDTTAARIRTICESAVRDGRLLRMPPTSDTDVSAKVALLQEQLDEMREALLQERKNSRNTLEPLLGVFGLHRTEARILSAIMRVGRATSEYLFQLIYGMRDDPPEENILRVHVRRIRKKLTPQGILIKTIYGEGFEISPEHAGLIRAEADRIRMTRVASPSIVPEQVPA
jgi:DNA-binding response OmpR family regulator